jgi:hypothetical protein
MTDTVLTAMAVLHLVSSPFYDYKTARARSNVTAARIAGRSVDV